MELTHSKASLVEECEDARLDDDHISSFGADFDKVIGDVVIKGK